MKPYLLVTAFCIGLALTVNSQQPGQPQPPQPQPPQPGQPGQLQPNPANPSAANQPPGAGLQDGQQATPRVPGSILTNPVANRPTIATSNRVALTNQFPATNSVAASSNRFMLTNQFASITNRTVGAASNQFGALTNQRPLTPTGVTSNRVFATNAISISNQTSVTIQDQTFTEADRTLLVQIRQAILPRVQAVGAWAPAFRVQDGVVTLLGPIQTVELQREIETTVSQTPGVVRVINESIVASTAQSPTIADEDLLVQVQAAALPQVQSNAWSVPAQFNVQQGVVTIRGTVLDPAQGQQLAAAVQQVPGVVWVNNQVSLSGAAATNALSAESVPGAESAPDAASAENAAIAASGAAVTNELNAPPPSISGVNTNLSPTGRTNVNPRGIFVPRQRPADNSPFGTNPFLN